MRTFQVLFFRELGALFRSPVAWVLLFAFSVVTAIWFLMCVFSMSNQVMPMGLMQFYFYTPFLWFCLIILIPLLTMRQFAEEYKMGTIEMLLTAPIREWDVVMAKYLSGAVIFLVMWFPTLLYYICFQMVTSDALPAQWDVVALCYGMVFMIGLFYLSVGLFSSSLTSNQIIAAMVSFAIILILFMSGFLAFFTNDSETREMIQYFSPLLHMRDAAEGRFDSRPFVLYGSGSVVFLTFTHMVLYARRLRG